MPPVVEVEHLSRSFGGRRVVDDVSLTVRPGEVFGLLGHNGAGKTTTVRVLCGVIARDAGRVSVLGLDPAVDGDAVRARVGVLTESPSLDDRFTAREQLAFFARLAGLDDAAARARIDELLAFFELSDRADALVEGFSKGMKQKVAIARALLARPSLLFLDEPTSGLDPVASRQLQSLLRTLATEEGHAVFFTTHRLAEAAALCDRVAIMSRGRKIVEGTPDDVVATVVGPPPVQLEVDDPARAVAVLGALAPPVAARVDGRHVVVDGLARDDVPALVAALVRGDVKVFGVSRQAKSLDDAYQALHAREGTTA
jgi:ABC-2 type transport system ATP-binding protein